MCVCVVVFRVSSPRGQCTVHMCVRLSACLSVCRCGCGCLFGPLCSVITHHSIQSTSLTPSQQQRHTHTHTHNTTSCRARTCEWMGDEEGAKTAYTALRSMAGGEGEAEGALGACVCVCGAGKWGARVKMSTLIVFTFFGCVSY
jgi:hypothetical protein